MIEIDALRPGDVVQMVSGSPMMTVRGFRGNTRPGKRPGAPMEMTRTAVICVVWVQRVGPVQHDFAAAELKLPTPRAREPVSGTADEGLATENTEATDSSGAISVRDFRVFRGSSAVDVVTVAVTGSLTLSMAPRGDAA